MRATLTAARKGELMGFKVGDRVAAESETTDRSARCGTVEAVLVEDRRYQILWDDGHTSMITPAAGALRPEGQVHPGSTSGG
jgi:Domain of unknown function (DUF1918)